ncbi:hypothetical protein ACFSL5_12990 [Ottowia pentelensis]
MVSRARAVFNEPGTTGHVHVLMVGLASLGLAACGGGDRVTPTRTSELDIVPDHVEVASGNAVQVPLTLLAVKSSGNRRVRLRVSDPDVAQVSPADCMLPAGTAQPSSCMVTVSGKSLGSTQLIAESDGLASDQGAVTVQPGNGVGTIGIADYGSQPTFTYYKSAANVSFAFTVQFMPETDGQRVYAENPISVEFTDTSGKKVRYQTNTVCNVTSSAPTCTVAGSFTATEVPADGFLVRMAVTGDWQTPGKAFADFNPIVISMKPVASQVPGHIRVASQNASNQIFSGSKAPLFVTLSDSNLTQASYTVTLKIANPADTKWVQFYDYPAGINVGAPTLTSIKTCELVVGNSNSANLKNTILGCGFNLWANPSGAALSGPTEVPIEVSVERTPETELQPADAALPKFSQQTILSLMPPSAANTPTRTITFSNHSSRTVVFAANSGSASAYVSPTATAGLGEVACGATAPTQACPIGSTCVQGGQNVDDTTPYQCFWDAPAFASNPVKPQGSTTATVPGYAGVTSGSQQIQWSGSYYALNCSSGAPDADCPAAPGTPGTSPLNPAQTVAEITYQRNAVDFYDVSIINGVSNALALGPSANSGKVAGSPVPGGPSGSITTPYACGTAGSAQAQTGTGASAYTLPASTWTLVPTAANFPAPPADSPASYYAVVSPSNPAQPTACSAQAACRASTAGDTVCGWNAGGLSLAGGNQRVCGAFQGWASANQIWGWNQTAGNAGNAVFGFGTRNGSGVTVGQLQLCTNPAGTIYSTYATAPPSSDAGLACGGTDWNASNIIFNPSTAPITRPAESHTTSNPTWMQYVYPTIAWLKMACPTCYTFPYDDESSTFNCEQDLNSQGTNTLDYTLQVDDLKNHFQ